MKTRGRIVDNQKSSVNARIINVSDAHPSWNWLANRFVRDSMAWYPCSSFDTQRFSSRLRRPASRVAAAISARRLLKQRSGRAVLVSHGPLATLYSAVFAQQDDCLHLAFSFNFTELPTGIRRILFRRYLKRVHRFVVASLMEKALYSDYFGIEANRIDLLLWSIQPPTAECSKPARFGSGRYICAIGSQGRDYATLIECMRLLPAITLVMVASPDCAPRGSIPPNVTIITNVPLADAMNVLAHSQFMVLPLRGSAIPCGHVTVVSALHMGKAILATNSTGLHDYLIEGGNAVLVPPDNPKQLAVQMELLFDDPALCAQLGSNGLEFARNNCMEDNAVAYFRRFLDDNAIIA